MAPTVLSVSTMKIDELLQPSGPPAFESETTKITSSLAVTLKPTILQTSTTVATTTASGGLNLDEISWYWIALGLAVPILLTGVFCFLDARHKRKGVKPKRPSTEANLDCICEQNKLVPPCYADVAIPSDTRLPSSSLGGAHANSAVTIRDEIATVHRSLVALHGPAAPQSVQQFSFTSAQASMRESVKSLVESPEKSAESTDGMASYYRGFNLLQASTPKGNLPRPSSSPQLSTIDTHAGDHGLAQVCHLPQTSLRVAVVSQSDFGQVCSVEGRTSEGRTDDVSQLSPTILTPPPYEDYENYTKVNLGACFEPPRWE